MSLLPAMFLASTILGTTAAGNMNADAAALQAKVNECLKNPNVIIKQIDAADLPELKEKLKELGISTDLFGNCIFPGNNQPDTDKPTPDQPDDDKPGTDDVPDTDKPDTDKPDTDKPDADKPGTDIPDNSNPDDDKNNNGGQDQDSVSNYASQVISLVNKERAKAGLTALKLDANTAKAAQVRAKEIVKSFSHTRPNGSSFSSVLGEYNVIYRGAGENIAWGQKTPTEVVNAWMNSDGHRANIMNKNYTSIGVGCYETNGTLYWTQLFTY